MPITASAKKALRQNPKRKAHNIQYRKKIKSIMKKALVFIAEKKRGELEKLIPSLYKILDKATKVGVIKKHTAARRKSRIARNLNALLKPAIAQSAETPRPVR